MLIIVKSRPVIQNDESVLFLWWMLNQSVAVEISCDSPVECKNQSIAGRQCSLNQRTLAEWADPLDAVEKCLETVGFRNRGEKWRLVNNGGQELKIPDVL